MKYIEEKAEKLLSDLKINSLPINPELCARQLKVIVEDSALDDDISGIFLAEEDNYYIIYNRFESAQRQRFTIAHELGHYILHKNSGVFVDRKQKTLFRNAASTTGEVLKEREANAFAAALLMPKFLVEREIRQITDFDNIVESLAEKFEVSKSAMSFRLSNLGYEFW